MALWKPLGNHIRITAPNAAKQSGCARDSWDQEHFLLLILCPFLYPTKLRKSRLPQRIKSYTIFNIWEFDEDLGHSFKAFPILCHSLCAKVTGIWKRKSVALLPEMCNHTLCLLQCLTFRDASYHVVQIHFNCYLNKHVSTKPFVWVYTVIYLMYEFLANSAPTWH